MTVDGKLEEACWPAAPVETTFVRDSGEALPAQQTSFRVAASGTHFYLAAEVQTADAALVTSGQAERDHSQILTRDESLLLSAFVEGVQYDFAVNSRGTQYDARSGDAAWNSTWQAAVTPTGNGWSVEIALPYMIFDSVGGMSPPPGYTTAFNVARMDAARRERSEWSPTFGDWRNEERLGTVAFP
jgi:hypothetical protein